MPPAEHPAAPPCRDQTLPLQARLQIDDLEWDRALAEGSARCPFAPVGHPEIAGMLYMLDLRETHGAIVTVAVYDQEAFSGAATTGLACAESHAAAVALRASNVNALACALHARDHDTEDHSRAVLALALAVGCELGLAERELLDLETVALLHDIGKIGISDAVLRKPGKLSEEEWAEMRRHPDIGADILAAMPSLSDLAPAIRAEHERWDGAGYPNGLRGEEIPLLSRIVFVCDAYHAMTSDRPYRRALAHAVALREIERNAGSQFCPRSAAALAHVLSATASPQKPAKARRPARARRRRTVSQAATR